MDNQQEAGNHVGLKYTGMAKASAPIIDYFNSPFEKEWDVTFDMKAGRFRIVTDTHSMAFIESNTMVNFWKQDIDDIITLFTQLKNSLEHQ